MGSDPLADLLVGRAARGARIFAVVQVASMGRAPRSRLGRRGGAGRAPRCCSASARRPAGRCGCRSPRPSGEGVLGEHAAGLMAPVDQGRMDLDLAPPARRGTAPRRRPCRPSAPRASPRAARAAAPPSGARRWARRRSARARPGPRARRPSPCRSSRPGHGRRPRDRAWRSARRDRSSDTALGGVRTTPAGPGAAQSRSARCSRTAREASSRGRSSALGTHRVWLASARTKRPSTATGSTDASPASRRRPTTRSKTARIRPPSRKRPRRFFVTVEWSGTRPSSPRRSEPPVGEVEPDPLAQPPLGADPMETAHQQHAHHPLGGDRGPARRAVVPRHAPARPGQLEHRVDPAGEVIRRHPLLEANLVRHSAARSTGRRIIAPLHPADPTGASEPCRLARAQGLLRRSRPVAGTLSDPRPEAGLDGVVGGAAAAGGGCGPVGASLPRSSPPSPVSRSVAGLRVSTPGANPRQPAGRGRGRRLRRPPAPRRGRDRIGLGRGGGAARPRAAGGPPGGGRRARRGQARPAGARRDGRRGHGAGALGPGPAGALPRPGEAWTSPRPRASPPWG